MNVRTSSELWQCNYVINGSPYSQRTDNIFILRQIFFISTQTEYGCIPATEPSSMEMSEY